MSKEKFPTYVAYGVDLSGTSLSKLNWASMSQPPHITLAYFPRTDWESFDLIRMLSIQHAGFYHKSFQAMWPTYTADIGDGALEVSLPAVISEGAKFLRDRFYVNHLRFAIDFEFRPHISLPRDTLKGQIRELLNPVFAPEDAITCLPVTRLYVATKIPSEQEITSFELDI